MCVRVRITHTHPHAQLTHSLTHTGAHKSVHGGTRIALGACALDLQRAHRAEVVRQSAERVAGDVELFDRHERLRSYGGGPSACVAMRWSRLRVRRHALVAAAPAYAGAHAGGDGRKGVLEYPWRAGRRAGGRAGGLDACAAASGNSSRPASRSRNDLTSFHSCVVRTGQLRAAHRKPGWRPLLE